MTIQEIFNAQKGYLERTNGDWRRTRWLATIIVNSHGNGKKTFKPTDLMKLPGDDVTPDFTNDIEEIKKHREAVKKQ